MSDIKRIYNRLDAVEKKVDKLLSQETPLERIKKLENYCESWESLFQQIVNQIIQIKNIFL